MNYFRCGILFSSFLISALSIAATISYEKLTPENAIQVAISESNDRTNPKLLAKIKKVSLLVSPTHHEQPYLPFEINALEQSKKDSILKSLEKEIVGQAFAGSRKFRYGETNFFTMDFDKKVFCCGSSFLYLEGTIPKLLKKASGSSHGIKLLAIGRPKSLLLESFSFGGGSGGAYDYQVLEMNGTLQPAFREATWQESFHQFLDADEDGIPELFFCSRSGLPEDIEKKLDSVPDFVPPAFVYETRLWKWNGKSFEKIGSYFDSNPPARRAHGI